MTMHSIITGEQMKELRLKLHISQAELGEIIGKDAKTIDNYEQGLMSEIPYDDLEKISNILQANLEYMQCLEDDEAEDWVMDAKFTESQDDVIDIFFSDLDDTERTFWKMQVKTPEELDDIIDSGVFKNHIEGFLTLALRAANYSEGEVNHIRMLLRDEIYGHVSAEEARKTGSLLGIDVDPNPQPQQSNAKIYRFPIFPSLRKK